MQQLHDVLAKRGALKSSATGCDCRERNDGLYRPITYLVAKMTEELTIFFFLSLVLTVIVFAPCNLGGSYILFWLVNFITTATGIGESPSRALALCTQLCMKPRDATP